MLSIESKVDSEKIRTRNLTEEDWSRIVKAATTLSNIEFTIIEDAFNLSEIRSIIARHAARGEITLVVIDYLQLLREQGKKFQSRQIELGYYANEIARIAKTYNTVILTLSQLNRAVENREDKRPRLSDLYESGAIEAAADIVLFLYRDEYYNPDSDEKGIAEIGAAKTRDGATGKCKLTWQGKYYRFDNSAREQEA
jgi:Replicative DNA helicase